MSFIQSADQFVYFQGKKVNALTLNKVMRALTMAVKYPAETASPFSENFKAFCYEKGLITSNVDSFFGMDEVDGLIHDNAEFEQAFLETLTYKNNLGILMEAVTGIEVMNPYRLLMLRKFLEDYVAHSKRLKLYYGSYFTALEQQAEEAFEELEHALEEARENKRLNFFYTIEPIYKNTKLYDFFTEFTQYEQACEELLEIVIELVKENPAPASAEEMEKEFDQIQGFERNGLYLVGENDPVNHELRRVIKESGQGVVQQQDAEIIQYLKDNAPDQNDK